MIGPMTVMILAICSAGINGDIWSQAPSTVTASANQMVRDCNGVFMIAPRPVGLRSVGLG